MNKNHPIKRVQFNTNTQVNNEMGRNTQNNNQNNNEQGNLSKEVANYGNRLSQLEGQITNFMNFCSNSFAGGSGSSSTNNNKPNDQ